MEQFIFCEMTMFELSLIMSALIWTVLLGITVIFLLVIMLCAIEIANGIQGDGVHRVNISLLQVLRIFWQLLQHFVLGIPVAIVPHLNHRGPAPAG